MTSTSKTVIDLETRFWQAMVDHDADAAVALLAEPAISVCAQGAMKFDRATYRQMAEQSPMVVTSFEFSDMEAVFPNDATAVLSYRVKQGIAARGKSESTVQEMLDTSTWIRNGEQWQCVLHTETPAAAKDAGA